MSIVCRNSTADPPNSVSTTLRNPVKLTPGAKLGLSTLVYSVPPSAFEVPPGARVGWQSPCTATAANNGNLLVRTVKEGTYRSGADLAQAVQDAANCCQIAYQLGARDAPIDPNNLRSSARLSSGNTGFQEATVTYTAGGAPPATAKFTVTRYATNAYRAVANTDVAVGSASGNLTVGAGQLTITDDNPFTVGFAPRSNLGAWSFTFTMNRTAPAPVDNFQISINDSPTNPTVEYASLFVQVAAGTYIAELRIMGAMVYQGVVGDSTVNQKFALGRAGNFIFGGLNAAADDTQAYDIFTQAWVCPDAIRDKWYSSYVLLGGQLASAPAPNTVVTGIGGVFSEGSVRVDEEHEPLGAEWAAQLLARSAAAKAAAEGLVPAAGASEDASGVEAFDWQTLEPSAPSVQDPGLGAPAEVSSKWCPGDMAGLLGFLYADLVAGTPANGHGYRWLPAASPGSFDSDTLIGGDPSSSTIIVVCDSLALQGVTTDDSGYGDDASVLDMVSATPSYSGVCSVVLAPPRYVSVKNRGETSVNQFKFRLIYPDGSPAVVYPGTSMCVSLLGGSL